MTSYQRSHTSACLVLALAGNALHQLHLSVEPGSRLHAGRSAPLLGVVSSLWTGNDAAAHQHGAGSLLSFRAGPQGQQHVVAMNESALRVIAVNGTQILSLGLGDRILTARMGAPSTVSLITPRALLALPLHPPRLAATLHKLGQLEASSSPGDAAAQLRSASGLQLSRAVGETHSAACQGLLEGEVLQAAAWEESLLAGSRGAAKKGPGIMPRALAVTSRGDLVRLAMLPGPQGTSKCQVRSRASASDRDLAASWSTGSSRLQFLAGAYLMSTDSALHVLNISAFLVSPVQLELRRSLADELTSFSIQDDEVPVSSEPVLMAAGSAGQLAVALGTKTVAVYRATWPNASPGDQSRSDGLGWELWTRPLVIIVAVGVAVWQFSKRSGHGADVLGGLPPVQRPAEFDAIMQSLSDSPRRLQAFQQDIASRNFRGRSHLHHSPNSVGIFNNDELSEDDSSDGKSSP